MLLKVEDIILYSIVLIKIDNKTPWNKIESSQIYEKVDADGQAADRSYYN